LGGVPGAPVKQSPPSFLLEGRLSGREDAAQKQRLQEEAALERLRERLPCGVSVRRIRKSDILNTDSPDADAFHKVAGITLNGQHRGVEVTAVDVWENVAAQLAFDWKKEELQRKTVTWVFHGSSKEGIEAIATEGFKVGGENGWVTKNGKALGKGVYTSSDFSTAMAYSERQQERLASPTDDNTHVVLLCRALPGVEWDLERPAVQPAQAPPLSVGPRHAGCETPLFGDSWSPSKGSGLFGSGTVRVFRTPAQLLPTYVVHYRTGRGSRYH